MSLNCRLEPTEKGFNEMEYTRKKKLSRTQHRKKKGRKIKNIKATVKRLSIHKTTVYSESQMEERRRNGTKEIKGWCLKNFN